MVGMDVILKVCTDLAQDTPVLSALLQSNWLSGVIQSSLLLLLPCLFYLLRPPENLYNMTISDAILKRESESDSEREGEREKET